MPEPAKREILGPPNYFIIDEDNIPFWTDHLSNEDVQAAEDGYIVIIDVYHRTENPQTTDGRGGLLIKHWGKETPEDE